MGVFNKFGQKRASAKGFQIQKTAFIDQKTFILEPILTPSGILDGQDNTPEPVVVDLETTPLPDIDLPDSDDAVETVDAAAIETDSIADGDTDLNVLAIDIADEELEPLDFVEKLDSTEVDSTFEASTAPAATTDSFTIELNTPDIEGDAPETVTADSIVDSDTVTENPTEATTNSPESEITVTSSETVDSPATNQATNETTELTESEITTSEPKILTNDSVSQIEPVESQTSEIADEITGAIPVSFGKASPTDSFANASPQVNFEFDSGVFTVGETGEVSVDFLFDGGGYKGELAIFSLDGMEEFEPGSEAFIKEAASRALSGSALGHVAISDITEGARFSGNLGEANQNQGTYLGVKTFTMRPGDTFGIMLVPNGKVEQVFDSPGIDGAVRPLFSLGTANPNDAFHTGQLVDVTGDGNTFVMEDMRVDTGSDKDYNDLIFQVRGATGSAISLDDAIASGKDWRTSDLGQALIAYAEPYVTPETSLDIQEDGLITQGGGIDDPRWGTIWSPLYNSTEFDSANTHSSNISPSDNHADPSTKDLIDSDNNGNSPHQDVANSDTNANISATDIHHSDNSVINFEKDIANSDNKATVVSENVQHSESNDTSTTEINVVTQVTTVEVNTSEPISSNLPTIAEPSNTGIEVVKEDIPVGTVAVESTVLPLTTEVNLVTEVADESAIPADSFANASEPAIASAPSTEVVAIETNISGETAAPVTEVQGVASPVVAESTTIAERGETIGFPAVQPRTNSESVDVTATNSNPVTTIASETPTVAVAQTPQPITPVKPPVQFEFPKENQPLVGVINTGFAANNPDLNYERIILGQDRIDGDANPLLQPGEGNDSGTPALGIIGATQNNNIGINGVNDDAPLWVGRAEFNTDQWAQSLIEFVDAAEVSKQPNAVINLGFSLTQTNPDGSVTPRYELTATERAALAYAQRHNVMIVVAAGDNGGQLSALGKAALEFDNIISVGAAERVNNSTVPFKAFERADYSNYGTGLDILADGGTAEKPITVTSGEGTGKAFGTSAASATVTGAVSQVWAANPQLNYTQVIDILKRTATDLGKPNWDAQTGAGLLNIAAAVSLAKVTTPELYTVKPGQETITDNFISQNNPAKKLPGDPAHPAVVPPGIPRTNVDQGANNLSGTRIRISATQDVIDQVSSIDPTDVYRGASRELAGAKFKVLTGQAVVSILSPSGQVLSRQVLSRGTHNLQIPANAPAEVLLKIDTNGTDATYVLQGFEAETNEPFDINLEFESPLTASQQQIMQAAARSVASLIGKGLPSAVVDGKIIDDINIKVSTANLDGASGTQARTKIDFMRYGTLLPAQSITQFDAADIAQLERSGQLFSVAQHEFLHALGFGNLWEAKGLVDYAGTPLAQYNGKQAVDSFKDLGGLTDAISLETEGKGSAGLHWNEMLFQDEVMTYDLGFKQGSDGQVFSPISAVTIASLADLGYQVNLNRATPDFGLFGGKQFNPDELTPEQIEAFRQLAEESVANQSGEFIPAIMPEVDPNKVAPEIWAHAERFWKNGEYYDWVPYQIKKDEFLSHLSLRYLGSAGYDYYMWIANHNGIPNPDYIVAGEWIEVPIHHPNYEQEKEQERLQREAELKKKQEEEAQKQKEAEEKLKNDLAEQEKFKKEQERLKQEAEAKQKELEEQAKKLAEELAKKRQHEEWLKEQARLAELARQAEIARQQGKGGQEWYFAKPLPSFGETDPFETSLAGETVGNLVPDDYYRFTLSRNGRITAELRKLLADADLVLYDARNEPIAYSMREGITDEQIVADLIPGTYMLRVNSPKGVTTDYDLIVKFQHKLSMTQQGPPPGWKVGGNGGNGGNGGVSGPTFSDPRIQQIYNTALNRFAAAERAKANTRIKDLEAEKRQYEKDLEKLLAQMNDEQRAKVHAQLDSARDNARKWVDDFVNPINNSIHSTADWIRDQIDSKIPDLVYKAPKIGDALRNASDNVKSAINGARDWLKGKVSAIQKALKDSIWWFFERIKQAYRTGGEVNALIEDAARILNDEITKATNSINDLVNQFKGTVLKNLGWLKNVGAFGWNFYDGVAEPLANSIANEVKDFISDLGDTASGAVNVVKPLAQKAVAYIADAIFGDKTGHLYNKIHGVDQQIANIKAGVEKAINNQAAFYKRLLDDFVKGLGEAGNFVLGALMGEFNDNPSIWQTLLDTAIGMIPIVGEIGDVRDLIAYTKKFIENPEEMQDPWNWVGVAGSLIGLLPVVGGAIKGVTKIARNADFVKEIKKLGPAVVDAVVDFARKGWQEVVQKSTNFFNKIVDTIKGLMTMANDGIRRGKEVWSSLGQSVGRNVDQIQGFLSKQVDNLGKLKDGAANKLKEAFNKLKEWFDELSSSAKKLNKLTKYQFPQEAVNHILIGDINNGKLSGGLHTHKALENFVNSYGYTVEDIGTDLFTGVRKVKLPNEAMLPYPDGKLPETVKTLYPAHWKDDYILSVIEHIAETNPPKKSYTDNQGLLRETIEGEFDGVYIRIGIKDGKIITAFPL